MTTTTKKTFCGICEASCGLIATVEHGVVSKIGPDPDHPSSQGFICIKGAQFHQVVADPDRVLHPMRRLPDGTFEQATWDEALDDIAIRLDAIRREHGGGAIGAIFGNPISWNYTAGVALNGFISALGTQHYYTSASLDINNYWAAADLLYGHTLVTPLPDFAATDFALILGANPVVSHGSLVTTGRIREVLLDIPARGGRVVVVDPRRSETAALFEHVPIRPGADPWLLAAILQVLFAEDLIDPSVRSIASGVEDLRALVERFDPARVEAETGVSPEVVTELARALDAAPRAVVYGRCGASLSQYSTLTKFLLDALVIVTGNLDRRGGMVFGHPMVDLESASSQFGRGRWKTRVSGVPELNSTAPLACLPEEITTPGAGKLRALFGLSSNVVTSAPGSAEVAAALGELDLMVWLDPYLTETSRHAHWVLPPTLWLEREQMPIFTQSQATVPNAQWVAPVVEGAGESRDDAWIIEEIARRIGINPVGVPGAQLLGRLGIRPKPRHLIDLALRLGPNGDLFGLRRNGLSRRKLMSTEGAVKLADECPTGVLAKKIKHKDGLIHLAQPEMHAEAQRLVGGSQDPAFGLRLFTVRELRSHNSWMHNIPRLMKGDRRCHALLHPDDAGGLGAEVRITSPWGAITVPLKVADEVAVGSVGLTQGWGHAGGWRTAIEAGGASYNVLTPTDPAEIDRPSGNAFFNGIPVAVTAVPD